MGEESEKWTPPFITIVSASINSYRSCSICGKTLSDDPLSICTSCSYNSNSNPGSTRAYHVLLSVATHDKVIVVICFDRTAQVLLGCSADEFFDFCSIHPCAAEKAAKILEGEMFKMTLLKSKKGNAENRRVVSVIPLRNGFCTVMDRLKLLYGT